MIKFIFKDVLLLSLPVFLVLYVNLFYEMNIFLILFSIHNIYNAKRHTVSNCPTLASSVWVNDFEEVRR